MILFEIFKRLRPSALLLLIAVSASFAQSLYTARGYWEESNKKSYRTIKQKVEKGDSLSNEEGVYAKDYEAYLANYFSRMSEEEKKNYSELKDQWDFQLEKLEAAPKSSAAPTAVAPEEFEFRNRDRFISAMYGAYYGTSLVVIADVKKAAAVGIPIMTAGLSLLGPIIMEKKYEGITQATIRASNTGRLFGLGYGWALATALGGESNDIGKLGLGLSTIGSIVMGELAFYAQKKKNISEGKIEVIRHYGFLGAGVGLSLIGSAEIESANLYGVSLLAGSITGMVIGKKAGSKYEYSKGDMAHVGSLSTISAGLGLAAVIELVEDSPSALTLVPAGAAVLGTILGQRAVKNVHLSNRQGSVLQLTTAGAAIIGIGVLLAIAQSESAALTIGIPSVLALIAHQAVFNKYKKTNLLKNIKGEIGHDAKSKYGLSMNVKPENYFINKQIPFSQTFNARMPVNPIVNFTLKFK